MRGVTPPHLYDLTPRESLFHGVAALRLNPVGGEDAIYGRSGLLAHTFMLGPNGDSNGCVSFRDYNAFLNAYRNQGIKRLAVVATDGLSGDRRVLAPPTIRACAIMLAMSEPDFQPTLIGPTIIVRPSRPATGRSCSRPAPIRKSGKCIRVPIATPSRSSGNFSTARSLPKWVLCSSIGRPAGLIGSSRYYGYEAELSEIEIGWTFIVRSHWGGAPTAKSNA